MNTSIQLPQNMANFLLLEPLKVCKLLHELNIVLNSTYIGEYTLVNLILDEVILKV